MTVMLDFWQLVLKYISSIAEVIGKSLRHRNQTGY